MNESIKTKENELLNELVSIQISKMVESGELHKKISSVVQGTAETVIQNQLTHYSEFGKAIDMHVKKALNYSLQETDFYSFSAMVVNHARSAIDQYYKNKAGEIMLEHIERLLKPLNITEIKLSEIVAKYKDHCRYDDLSKVYFLLENSDVTCLNDYYHLYIDKKDVTKYDKWKCEYNVAFNKNGIYSISSGSREIHKEKLILANEFEGFLFQLCAMKVPLILDTEEAEEASYFESDED
jgi:hypothetical protein